MKQKHIKHLLTALSITTLACLCTQAHATVMKHVTETFSSGASFDGILGFSDSLDNVLSVQGTLSGGSYGNDAINWIWNPDPVNPGSAQGANQLMDGQGVDYSNYDYTTNFIAFSWDFTVAGGSGFSDANGGNSVNFSDNATGGTISTIPTVAEPGSLALLAAAAFGLVGVRRTRKE